MTDAHGVARDQLRAFIERIERLEEEKKTIADDIKDVYGEAKGTGFIPAMIKKVIALRKKDEQERMEEEAILDTYLAALGMLSQHDLFEESAPASTTRQPAMALRSPRQAAEAVSERTAVQDERNVEATVEQRSSVLVGPETGSAVAGVLGQPETIPALTVQHDGVNVSGPERVDVTGGESAATNPEMDREEMRADEVGRSLPADNARKAMPETERGDVTHAGAGESPATYPEIDPSEDRQEGQSFGGDADANMGGGHVTDSRNAQPDQAGGLVQRPPAKKPLRPHCRNPGDNCGGYGSTHCSSCLKASKEVEVAA
jgi:uncharacterized protein (UPF0335 family)